MAPGEAFLRKLLSSRRTHQAARRGGPIVAATILNVSMVAGFAAASVDVGKLEAPVGRPPEPMAVTLVLADFIPPPPQRPHPRPQASAPAGENGASISSRKRKSKGSVAPAPEIEASPDVAAAGEATASVAPDGVPEGLRSLLEKPEPCGPTSERNRRSDCSGQYAKLVPPVDDWSLPDLHGYEARFGHVIGVEEERRLAIAKFALMGKPAGHLDPVWGD
jgi:hypothetical protein